MSDCRHRDERIDAYVDGTLSDIERHELEAHLHACDRCRAELEGIRAVVARAARLPREIAPTTDRWGDLRTRIHAVAARPAAQPPSRLWASRPLVRLAAAIVLTAALSSGVTMLLVRPAKELAPPVAGVSPAGAASVAQLERHYAGVTQELAAELEARRGELSPVAIATVERNLRVIDEALAEARAALALEPDNPTLVRMLAAAYEHKLDLLRQATRLSPSS